MQDKWRDKLAGVMDKKPAAADGEKVGKRGAVKRFMERYAMFALPFVTVLREGIEAVVFIAGVTFSAPASAVPLAVVVGLAAGAVVGFALYK
jgi:high-affinity iron transporter